MREVWARSRSLAVALAGASLVLAAPGCGSPPGTCDPPASQPARVDWDCLDAQQAIRCEDGTCRCYVDGEPSGEDEEAFPLEDLDRACPMRDEICLARFANRRCGWAIPVPDAGVDGG